MTDPSDPRLKRLKVRAWRRGIKEMDLILGRFVDECGTALSAAELDALDSLMEENDLDLYSWIAGRSEPPEAHAGTIRRIAEFAAAGSS